MLAKLWAALFGAKRKPGKAADQNPAAPPPEPKPFAKLDPSMLHPPPVSSDIGGAPPPRFDPARSPYPIVTVHGRDATTTWRRLRDEGNGTPVILGDDEQAERMLEFDFDARSPGEIIAAAAGTGYPDSREAHYHAEFGDEAAEFLEELSGEWPTEELAGGVATDLTVSRHILTGQFHERVHIIVLPTQDPTEAPAYLKFGNWNDCPAPEVHVAALRSWRDRYGAVIATIAGDVMELYVERPPQTREDAMSLALEQMFYCTDIVEQGTGTIPALAQTLLGSRWWYFWWD